MAEGAEGPTLTPEIEEVLTRYLEIQEQQRALREEKTQLQDKLRAHLRGAQGSYWRVSVADTDLRIRHVDDVDVTYDEEALKERLGERYEQILTPDWRKVRRHLDEVGHYLEPVLGRVGSPDREKVKAAVEDGLIAADEFAGAFRKEVVTHIAVMRERRQ